MLLSFTPIQTRPQRPTYGAVYGNFTFVITLNDYGQFHASAKRVIPLEQFHAARDRTQQDLGNFKRFVDAAQACEQFARKNTL